MVLVAEPGAGKTTRVPSALADMPSLAGGQIWVLEPRRVAARAAARRVAEEMGERVGETVGYRVRFENRTGPSTRIVFVTEGVLTRRLLNDPFLQGVSAVVFDEFHERSLEADLGFGLVREVRQSVREDLAVVVMSATLDAAPIAQALDGATILEVPGRSYPVETDYLLEPTPPPLPVGVRLGVEHLLEQETPGSILAFLPGVAEIRAAERELENVRRRFRIAVYPLYGDLRPEEQDRAIHSSERRIVLATNIAEASLTVNGVRAVVDSGRVRVARFDPWVGLDRLTTERISQASARQRAGRAGRLGPGACLRLYSEDDLERWPAFAEPEVSRVDLTGALLTLKSWADRDPVDFPWLTTPPPEQIESGLRLLRWMGAIDERGRITSVGRQMLAYPVPPRHARVLVAANEEDGTTGEGRGIDATASAGEGRGIGAAGAAGEGRGIGATDSAGVDGGIERLRVAEEAALWVALLSERDPRHRKKPAGRGLPRGRVPTGKKRGGARSAPPKPARRSTAVGEVPSDLFVLADLFREAESAGFDRGRLNELEVDGNILRRVARVRDQLLRAGNASGSNRSADQTSDRNPAKHRSSTRHRGSPEHRSPTERSLLRALLAGHPDRVCLRSGTGSHTAVMVGRVTVRLEPDSVVDRGELFLALEATGHERDRDRDRKTRQASPSIRVWTASGIEESWLAELFPNNYQQLDTVRFDPKTERARNIRERRFHDLVLDARDGGEADPEAMSAALAAAAEEDTDRALGADRDRENLQQRMETLARYRPDLEAPSWEESLRVALRFLAEGCRSFSELRKKPIVPTIIGLLPEAVRKALEVDAPTHLEMPSGWKARIDYSGDRPTLAVQVQDLFGTRDLPQLGNGKVPLLLHLLAPSRRPVQVTQDLAGFWEREYPRVRNELKRRYPKHPWPEDPLTAEPPKRSGKKRGKR